MQLVALAALFGAAIAAPAPQASGPDYEVLNITDYYLTTQLGQIKNVVFNLTGTAATDLECRIDSIEEADVDRGTVFPCDPVDGVKGIYSFAIVRNSSDVSGYGQRFYHALGPGAGFYGEGTVQTTCNKFEPIDISPTVCAMTRYAPYFTVTIDSK